MPQRVQRIQSRRASRGDDARHGCDDRQQRNNRDECQRIARACLNEKRLQQPADTEGTRDADHQAYIAGIVGAVPNIYVFGAWWPVAISSAVTA
jgi:hypothetical protein